MVQTTKWADTEISDLRLNEQTLFWGTSDPSSGLPTNSWFLNTTDNILKQNTGTEGSPTWTNRLNLTIESVEQRLDQIADTTDSNDVANSWHGETFTLPTTEKLYRITDIETTFGAVGGGTAILAAFLVDANPPVTTRPRMVALTEEFVPVASTIHKIETGYSVILRGGSQLFIAVNRNVSTSDLRHGTIASRNNQFSETYTINPEINRSITWTASTLGWKVKIYFRGYI